jgi:formyltetrahydrofolate-dependent phosphoribosylglycinamide formyltransferase|tara:strand:+ start:1151 stop:1792 length:642 start_codon:yes stop_codon:yes gene_type:complete
MCSGKGTNFENILVTCNKHEVVLMIHDKKECGAEKKAAKYGIPHIRVKHTKEDEMIALFKAYRVDLIVLAGYMRILKRPLDFHCPIINVHPSLLPKYKGLHAVEQALDSNDTITGCTVHYVNEDLDGGEIIAQSKVDILPDDTVDTLTRRIQLMEYGLLPDVIDHYETTVSKSEGKTLSAVGARPTDRAEEYSSRGHRVEEYGGGWRRLDYGS